MYRETVHLIPIIFFINLDDGEGITRCCFVLLYVIPEFSTIVIICFWCTKSSIFFLFYFSFITKKFFFSSIFSSKHQLKSIFFIGIALYCRWCHILQDHQLQQGGVGTLILPGSTSMQKSTKCRNIYSLNCWQYDVKIVFVIILYLSRRGGGYKINPLINNR